MNASEKRPRCANYDTMYEVNRLSQNVSAVFMHFSVYYYVKKNPVTPALFLILTAISAFIFFLSKRVNTRDTLTQASIILAIAFLVTNILKTLVDGISDGTAYLHFIVLGLFFVFDTTRCAIMNDVQQKVSLSGKPLPIEYVDILKMEGTNVPLLGYNATLLSTIILTSRLSTNADVFFLLSFTFFWYFVVEHCIKSAKRRVEFVFSILIIVLTSIIYINVLVSVFYAFIVIQSTLYIAGLMSICFVNKEIR